MRVEIDESKAAEFVARLRDDESSLVEAAVADGWPKDMVRAGFENHWKTWDVAALSESVRRELALVEESPGLRWIGPRRIHHIWPALPGAGLTPVLVGMLLDIPQAVRPSSRGLNLARQIASHAPWGLIEPDQRWEDADVVVVSGSDETLKAIGRRVGPRGRVVGYGHRVSFAVVVDVENTPKSGAIADSEAVRETDDLRINAADLARDVVMWHQQGCFSVRAVLFVGSDERRRQFAKVLARKIADVEAAWEADSPGDGELARRAQSLGVAQMSSPVFCEGLGYVRLVDEPFRGRREAIHSVTVHGLEGPGDLEEVVDLPRSTVQGVAMAGDWAGERGEWIEALGRVGATRIARAGEMQAPPADWWHDGRPNLLDWGQVVRF